MATIVKIDHIRLSKLNNAEYAEFLQTVFTNMITMGGYLKLGLTQPLWQAFGAKKQLMIDIVSQSRVSDETAKIADADAACEHALRYLLGVISDGRYSPIENDRKDFQTLYNLTKPYRGIQSLPQRQQIAQTRGLVIDLGKEQYVPMVTKLGLGQAIQVLDRANEEFDVLLNTRAGEQLADALPAAKAVRAELDALYDEMMSLVFVTSVSAPTEFTEQFVAAQNKLIHDTNAAYNLRMGLHDYWKKKHDAESGVVEPEPFGNEADEVRRREREAED